MIPHVIYSTQPQFSGGVYSQREESHEIMVILYCKDATSFLRYDKLQAENVAFTYFALVRLQIRQSYPSNSGRC